MKQITMGIVAHVDSGKTTLSEGLLYTAGNLRQLGRVDKGDAFLDTFDMERERGITIFSKQAILSWEDIQITLLDTPGHVDFSAEMERTLQVLDYAILVISGADGVQGHTRTLWRLLQKYEIPAFIFVNKMDQPGTDKEEILQSLQSNLGSSIVDFSDVESDEFKEAIALCEETLLDEFLENGDLDISVLPRLIREQKVNPCYFGSALKLDGVEKFLKGIAQYTVEPVYPETFGAKVFKIARDEQGNRLTYVKITGGSLKARMELSDDHMEWKEKVNQIRIYSGNRFETIPEATAGMVCALTGLTQTYPGEGLGIEEKSEKPVLIPILTYRIILPQGCDPALFLPKLRMLEEEEPELHILWKEELQEIHAQVMGEVQIEILQRLIADRYGVEVTFDTGNIVYKETIRKAVEGVGHYEPLRHYSEVHLWMEPLEAGSGFVVDTKCSEDSLDKNWQRLILTHLLEKEHRGVLTGSVLTDVKVTLIAGRAHLKHTEGGDFRQSVYRAVRQGLMQTESCLLEPYYEFRLEVPGGNVGRAMTDIERMAGTFTLEESKDGMSVLSGSAPVVNMRDYVREVNAYTKGQGHLFCTLSGYRPCHNEQEVVETIGYDPEKDVENPSGSVFCAHGAGFYVPWEEVKNYMHIDTGYGREKKTEEKEEISQRGVVEEWMDVEEIDHILDRATYANRRETTKKKRVIPPKQVGLSKPGKTPVKKDNYLLVDGYNIIFAWEELKELTKINIDAARGRLMDILCDYQGFKKCELILVFDAYRVQNHKTEMFDYHNIHIVYTKEAETADAYIEKFAHDNAKKYNITVATSDGLEQVIIRGAGCRLLSARELKREIETTKNQMKEFLNSGE